jgi:hypothetical protein
MSATAVAHKPARASRAPGASAGKSHRSAPARHDRRPLRLVRTAVAISDAADSPLLVRLTRSQAWIAIVGALLIGIVALNVYSLGMGSAVSSTAARAAELERENSLLREQIGKLRKNGEIERSAAKLGLGQPTSEQLVRVLARKGDAQRAAARLTGELTAGTAAVTTDIAAVSAEPTTAEVATDPVTTTESAAGAATATETAASTAPPPETGTFSEAPASDPTAASAGGVAP